MRKILGILLTAALIVPGPAGAELFNNLKVSGSLDIQNTSARNALDFATGPNTSGSGTTAAPLTVTAANNDRIGSSLTRTMLQAEWDMLDDVHATVGLLKNDRAWATTAVADDQQTLFANHQTVGATGGTDVLGNIQVHLANVKIDKMFGFADMTFGRQYYGEAGDLIYYLGPRDSLGLPVASHDALRVDASNDWMTFSGVYATTGHSGGIGTANNGTYVRGFDLGWKNMPMKANTFLWNQVTQRGAGALALGTPPTAAAAGAKNDNLWVYGVKLRGEAAGGWVSLDAAGNLGENRGTGAACTSKGCNAAAARYRGWGFLADAGYNAEVANIGGFTPWATFGFGTGRSSNMEAANEGFTQISTDFRPGVINRRFGALTQLGTPSGLTALGAGRLNSTLAGGVQTVGLNNRVVWGTGLNYTPAMEDRLTLGASFWDFRFQRITDTTTVGAPAHGGNKHIGSEFGLTGEWRHSENVALAFGWANFAPGGFVKNEISSTATTRGAPVSPIEMWFADLSIKF